MSYKILLHRRVVKFLKRLDESTRSRVLDSLRELDKFPNVRLDIVKIAGEKNIYRIRIGDLRILMKVYDVEKIIVIVKIDRRKRSYRGLRHL
ncbi:type II toxin-antitoxin system RelE/ParE family toxin [Candidatus Bathyarchaeota archaeon]|nr:MAG: type II toxin-antitoxin system RelE/ParE family toxin [Candidatus Bathyarchaeota archaeon]